MIDIVLSELDEKLVELYGSPPRQGNIHPSQLAAGCPLRVYYDLTKAPYSADVTPSAETQIIFLLGHYLQNVFEEALKKIYEEHGGQYFSEVPLQISKHCKGTCDGLGIHDGSVVLYEFKTIGKSGFSTLNGPSKEYLFQVHAYNSVVEADKIVFIYICRDNGQWKYFVLDRDKEKEEEVLSKIAEVEKAFEERRAPSPKPYWSYKGMCIRSCFYKDLCPANDPATAFAGGKLDA